MLARFRFDGRQVEFQDGDTIGSALHRDGVLELSRSLKYHRARGLYCNAGSCGSCLVDVDGEPNVPACMAKATAGAEVESQNRIGSAKRDLLAVTDKVYRRGFDPHGAFTKPRILNAIFLKAVRFMSGLGRAPEEPPTGPAPIATEETVDELIVGAGQFGLLRAHAAAEAGKRILLVDESETLGGSACWTGDEPNTKGLAATVADLPGVEVWTQSVVFGIYDDGVGIRRGQNLAQVNAKRITICAGRHDGWPLFANNDLPGVMSLRGAQRLLSQDARPGAQVVMHSDQDHPEFHDALTAAGGRIVASGAVTAVRGGTRVEEAQVNGKWVDCDAVVCHVPMTPRVELLQQAGCALAFQGGQLQAVLEADGKTTVDGVYVEGFP